MEILTFFYPVLKALESGKAVRKAVAIALQIVGGLVLAAGLALLFALFKDSFRMPTPQGTLGAVLFALIMAVTFMCVAQTFFYRAECIRKLGESRYTVIPVFSLLLRATGEAWGTTCVAVGIGGSLFIWFARYSPMPALGMLGSVLPNYQADATVLGGLGFLCNLLVAGVLLLLLFYFLAESVLVVADIAVNVRRVAGQSTAPEAPGAQPVSAEPLLR
jgi:hypothetical protein